MVSGVWMPSYEHSFYCFSGAGSISSLVMNKAGYWELEREDAQFMGRSFPHPSFLIHCVPYSRGPHWYPCCPIRSPKAILVFPKPCTALSLFTVQAPVLREGDTRNFSQLLQIFKVPGWVTGLLVPITEVRPIANTCCLELGPTL